MVNDKDLLSFDYKKDFPLLAANDVAYLDNSATTQKPACVIEAERDFYLKHNANPLRGLYDLAMQATDIYEDARVAVQKFINAKSEQEIIFTRNTTESLNLVAYSYGLANLKSGDEIVTTIMEHHSNMLPWRMVAQQTGAVVKYIECAADGSISDEAIDAAVTEKTKIVAMAEVSNVLGRLNPVAKAIAAAHKVGAVAVIDAAQSAPHMAIDVQKMDADFLAFSGHKMLGPMGIGVLYGKKELLEAMPPFLSGGEMISFVSRDGQEYAPLPHKFEAGTVNAAGAAGLHAAIEYINSIGFEVIEAREAALTKLAFDAMQESTLRERADQLLAHHRRRLDDAERVIGEHPGLNAYQIAGMMQWKIRAKDWDDFPPGQKYFAMSETLAHLEHLLLEGRIQKEQAGDEAPVYLIK